MSNVVAKGRIFYCGPQLSRQNQKPHGKNKIPHGKTKNLKTKNSKPKTSHWLRFSVQNRLFAGFHLRGTKPANCEAKVALGQEKQRKLPFKIMYAFCWSCPSATFASQYAGFVPREWKPAKGLLHIFHGSMVS